MKFNDQAIIRGFMKGGWNAHILPTQIMGVKLVGQRKCMFFLNVKDDLLEFDSPFVFSKPSNSRRLVKKSSIIKKNALSLLDSCAIAIRCAGLWHLLLNPDEVQINHKNPEMYGEYRKLSEADLEISWKGNR